jgi:hypothetical protein
MPRQKARGPTTVAVRRAAVSCPGETRDDSAPDNNAQAVTTIARASPLRLVIEPTPSGRKWTARLGESVLCVSAWPFVKSARRLLAEGHPTDAVIEIWRPNTDEWAMRGRLGAVAATLIDGEAGLRGAKNGPPARDLELGRGKGRPLACARPRAVSGVGDRPPKRSKHSRRGTTARATTRKRLEHRRKTQPRR